MVRRKKKKYSEKVSSRGYAPNVGESVEKWRQRRLKERRLEIAHYRKKRKSKRG
jgi:hypothetical protein